MNIKILPVLIVIFISACSATGPIYQEVSVPNDGGSDLYVYRPDTFVNFLIAPGIVLDDKEVFVLKNGGYSKLNTEPGIHRLSIKLSDNYKGNSEVKIETMPNKKTFVKMLTYNESTGSRFRRVFTLLPVDEFIAIKEIKECRYINSEKSEKFKKSIFWADD